MIMTKETEQPDGHDASDTTMGGLDASVAANDSDRVEVNTPEFQEMSSHDAPNDGTDLDRFQNIKVTVSADLGRAEVPIQTLMNLGEGSVLELNREIDSPVELVAQGVPLACGEVVVVNGCFAVRVTQVYENKKANE